MPIYEYRCESCGASFEKMVRLSAPTPACEVCGAADVRKLISQTSFVLKGSGWYSDHYGLKKSSSGGEASSGGGSSSGSSGSSSSGGSSSGGSSTPAGGGT